jgi:hypothetical protein
LRIEDDRAQWREHFCRLNAQHFARARRRRLAYVDMIDRSDPE